MVWILLAALAALMALHFLKKFKRLDGSARHRVGRDALFVVGAVAAIVIFSRIGLHWLGVVVAGGWALLRGLVPFALRLLPLVQRDRGRKDKRPHEAPRPRELLSRKEALEVLGLEEGASREQILASYRQLMRKVHPDSPGGSNYLATKLNQARDVLLD